MATRKMTAKKSNVLYGFNLNTNGAVTSLRKKVIPVRTNGVVAKIKKDTKR